MEEKDKVLFLITDNYPFGIGEEFIENEIEILANKFKKIYIISRNEKDKQTRKVPNNCVLIRLDTSKFKKKYKIKILAILLDKYYLIDYLKNGAKRKIRRYQFTAKNIEEKILEIIRQENLTKDEIVVYSYWFYYGAYAASMLKRKNIVGKVISRAHGYDVFFERGPQYLKKETLEKLDYLYPCSKNNEKYLKNKYGNKFTNIQTSYLGTINKNKFRLKENSLTIVSCSNLISLKRVELIMETLHEISKEKDYNQIKWIHFGDGVEKNKLLNLAKNKLNKIEYIFKGEVSNSEVLEFYKDNDIKVFIHLSSSEGLPVSMMEAQSFGIPIIATDVGGVREIVNSKTGILLSSNPKINEIVDALKEMLDLSQERYNEYQRNSYENWKENFNAEINYEKFVEELLESSKF